MKQTFLMLALSGFILSGCNDHDHDNKPAEHCLTIHKYHPTHPVGSIDTASSEFIPADTANVMINSYLTSIGHNDTDLHSLIYSADSLRTFLADPTVVGVKFMFAHTTDYINGGGYGLNCGYQSGALTLVIAGYNAQGNYVFYYYPKSQCPMVKDHCQPCPQNCPQQGTASSDTLIVQPQSKR